MKKTFGPYRDVALIDLTGFEGDFVIKPRYVAQQIVVLVSGKWRAIKSVGVEALPHDNNTHLTITGTVDVSISNTGNASVEGEGNANTGVQGVAGRRRIKVKRTGNATVHGSGSAHTGYSATRSVKRSTDCSVEHHPVSRETGANLKITIEVPPHTRLKY